jgi:zinc transporter 5/7
MVIRINLGFTFVEFIYGYWSNSLGLISDSFHMLFDSTAIAIGLYANYMSSKQPTDKYPFGFHRFETISGFINAIFLVFVAFHIFAESLERVFD